MAAKDCRRVFFFLPARWFFLFLPPAAGPPEVDELGFGTTVGWSFWTGTWVEAEGRAPLSGSELEAM